MSIWIWEFLQLRPVVYIQAFQALEFAIYATARTIGHKLLKHGSYKTPTLGQLNPSFRRNGGGWMMVPLGKVQQTDRAPHLSRIVKGLLTSFLGDLPVKESDQMWFIPFTLGLVPT